MSDLGPEITPELLLHAYASGVFPMADDAKAEEIYWVEPKLRGVFDIGGLHVSRSLRHALLKDDYEIRVDHDFLGVVAACADRPTTWINTGITQLYDALHDMGYAHSVEVYRDQNLIGGIYGVALNGAFFGESMFSRGTNGSKIALTYLMARLKLGGFRLFDTQFLTEHLANLGAYEIKKSDYQSRLGAALEVGANFKSVDTIMAQDAIQASTQTS
ncbi:MAG: leucyl/phenylalanyl-tRNA--protein transferase [Pseudomonadota bacterium]